jgi:hypothetical protein
MYASALFSPVVAASFENVYVGEPRRRRHTVREPGAARYEAEGSERRTLGSISLAPDAHWAATLTIPIPDADVAFVRVERHGPLPADYRGGQEAAELSVPVGEVEAVLAMLTGLVDQARRDGVIPN